MLGRILVRRVQDRPFEEVGGHKRAILAQSHAMRSWKHRMAGPAKAWRSGDHSTLEILYRRSRDHWVTSADTNPKAATYKTEKADLAENPRRVRS